MNLKQLTYYVRIRRNLRYLAVMAMAFSVSPPSFSQTDGQSNMAGDMLDKAKQAQASSMPNPFEHKVSNMDKSQQIEFAKGDLSEMMDVDAKAVKLLLAQAVTWRSGALGCPAPGMNYTQALVKGMRIVLQSDGKKYHYHAKANGKPFYCEASRAESPTANSGDA